MENTQECYALFWINPRSSTLRKTPAVRPLTSHLTNHPSKINKTCWSLLRSKNELISNVLQWTFTNGHCSNGWPASSSVMCRHWMPSRGLTNIVGWWSREFIPLTSLDDGVYTYELIYFDPSTRALYDIRSIFSEFLTGLKSVFFLLDWLLYHV